MKTTYIGTGGWAYLGSNLSDNLQEYSRLFRFVEVNSTFYFHPRLSLVKSWRARVPSEFVFSVRCHKDLTHKFGLTPCENTFRTFDRMVALCTILNAPILHLQTPPSLRFDKERSKSAREFFGSINIKNIKLAWEVRAGLNDEISRLMQDLDIIPCIDLSKEKPPFETEKVYSRLFGKGIHTLYQFDDDELGEIEGKVKESTRKQTFLVFHGLGMYQDAHRLKFLMENGKFPKPKGPKGIQSLKEILFNSKFPCSKEELIQNHGWKVMSINSGKRIHVSNLLHNIPKGIYEDIYQVIEEIEDMDFD